MIAAAERKEKKSLKGTMFIKKYGHHKKVIFFIAKKIIAQMLWNFHKHAVGVFKEDILVGHVPIELSLISS